MKFLYKDLAPVQQCIQAEEYISGAPLHTGDLKTNETTKEIEVALTALQKTKLHRHDNNPQWMDESDETTPFLSHTEALGSKIHPFRNSGNSRSTPKGEAMWTQNDLQQASR